MVTALVQPLPAADLSRASRSRLQLPHGRLHLPLVQPVRRETAELLVLALPDGRRAVLGFTDVEILVGALGEHAPWAAWLASSLPTVLAAARIEVLFLDAGGPGGRRLDVGGRLNWRAGVAS